MLRCRNFWSRVVRRAGIRSVDFGTGVGIFLKKKQKVLCGFELYLLVKFLTLGM